MLVLPEDIKLTPKFFRDDFDYDVLSFEEIPEQMGPQGCNFTSTIGEVCRKFGEPIRIKGIKLWAFRIADGATMMLITHKDWAPDTPTTFRTRGIGCGNAGIYIANKLVRCD